MFSFLRADDLKCGRIGLLFSFLQYQNIVLIYSTCTLLTTVIKIFKELCVLEIQMVTVSSQCQEITDQVTGTARHILKIPTLKRDFHV